MTMDQDASLPGLPVELLEDIAELLERERDVNSLCRAHRRLHAKLTSYLYNRNARHRDDYYNSSAVGWAARNGRPGTIRRAIESGVSVADEKGVLGKAVCWGHFLAAEALLSVPGIPLYCDYHSHRTPLGWAAHNGDMRVAKLLIDEHGVDVNKPYYEGEAPLFIAVERKQVEMAKFLIARGAQVEPPNPAVRQPIQAAARNGHCELGRLLLDHGSRPDGHEKLTFSPVHRAALCGNADFLELLLERGADMDRRVDLTANNRSEKTAIQLAFRSRELAAAKLLLEKGADTSAIEGCETLLYVAAFYSECAMLELLFKHGVDYGKEEAYRVVCRSTKWSEPDVLKVLFNHGITAERAGEGMAPLMVAVNKERVEHEKVELLINAGADVHERDSAGRTVLHHAAYRGDVMFVNMLLEKGADPMATDTTGATSIHQAARGGGAEVIRVLRGTEGVDMYALDCCGRTPFFHAAMGGSIDALRALTDPPAAAESDDNVNPRGMPGNIRDVFGVSPIVAAARNESLGVCNMLLNELEEGSVDKADMDIVEPAMCGWEVDDKGEEDEDEDEDGSWSNWPSLLERENARCDTCTRPVLSLSRHPHGCAVCHSGKFLVCTECIEAGATCFDPSHELIPRKVDYLTKWM